MIPGKVERGRQPGRGSETSEKQTGRSQSRQKRRSTSRGCDQVDYKKGKTDGGSEGTMGGKDWKIKVGIDWRNTAIEEPTPKVSSHHSSFKPDRSGTSKSPPEPMWDNLMKIKPSWTTPMRGKGQWLQGRTPAAPLYHGSVIRNPR